MGPCSYPMRANFSCCGTLFFSSAKFWKKLKALQPPYLETEIYAFYSFYFQCINALNMYAYETTFLLLSRRLAILAFCLSLRSCLWFINVCFPSRTHLYPDPLIHFYLLYGICDAKAVPRICWRYRLNYNFWFFAFWWLQRRSELNSENVVNPYFMHGNRHFKHRGQSF